MRNNLDATSLILQLYSVILLLQDYNNRDLMQELQTQDEVYLKKIIEQNEQIIELLERRENETKNRFCQYFPLLFVMIRNILQFIHKSFTIIEQIRMKECDHGSQLQKQKDLQHRKVPHPSAAVHRWPDLGFVQICTDRQKI